MNAKLIMIYISLVYINVCDSSKKDEEKEKNFMSNSSAIFDPQTASDNGGIRYRSVARKRLKSGNALSKENDDRKSVIVAKKKKKKLRKSETFLPTMNDNLLLSNELSDKSKIKVELYKKLKTKFGEQFSNEKEKPKDEESEIELVKKVKNIEIKSENSTNKISLKIAEHPKDLTQLKKKVKVKKKKDKILEKVDSNQLQTKTVANLTQLNLIENITSILQSKNPCGDYGESCSDGEEEFDFPEPMVTDPTLGLGSKPGDTETSYLMIIPLNGDPIETTPEVESSIAPSQAIEVEFPFENKKPDGFTFAYQKTTTDEPFFKEGFQIAGSCNFNDDDDDESKESMFRRSELAQNVTESADPDFELTAVYMSARKLAPQTSNYLMIGFQLEAQKVQKSSKRKKKRFPRIRIGGLILNHSIFYKLANNVILGLEIQIYISVLPGESYVAFYPQVHVTILPIFQLQMGVGLYCTKEKFVPQFVHRPIIILTDVIKNLNINDVIPRL